MSAEAGSLVSKALQSPVPVTLFVLILAIYLYASPKVTYKNIPPQARNVFPVIGAHKFFVKRWDWFEQEIARSKHGIFSFFAGDKLVIGMSGEEARKIFFESKDLNLGEGYAALLGGTPPAKKSANPEKKNSRGQTRVFDDTLDVYFRKSLAHLVKSDLLVKRLPSLTMDICNAIDELAGQPEQRFEAYDTMFDIVARMICRTVGCNELANNTALRLKYINLFKDLENSVSPMSVMYSWLPVPGKIKRYYAGFRMYLLFKKIVDNRKAEGITEDDALQYLIDQGASMEQVIHVGSIFSSITFPTLTSSQFEINALFAGQGTSSFNSAALVCYLVANSEWQEKVLSEMTSIANQYSSSSPTLPLISKLKSIPFEAWSNSFPILDLCLRETQRLTLPGALFRRNIGSEPISLNADNSETIPAGAYATYHMRDLTYNPNIFPNPETWDPARFSPERAEDKKHPYGFVGWGVNRHPCAGMKFAKLELFMITAYLLASFKNMKLVDEQGKEMKPLSPDPNLLMSRRPKQKVYVTFERR